MKTLYFITIFCLFYKISNSQEGIPFKESKQLYLQGNSILIGNNILGEHPKKPLMNFTIPNDLVDMTYIDVDDDPSTFSSSEASILHAHRDSKIKFAALYWSGLYPYKKGVLKESGNNMVHVGVGNRDKDVNAILFKTPYGKYETIIGNIIYDDYNSKTFETNKPYVCYADVTTQLQNLEDLNGSYAAANIKATEGKISGGGSAGWLLYIIYEDLAQSPKYFNIYNGLLEVNKTAVEVSFKDFKSKEEGEVQTTIALGVMEGDRRIKTDQVSVLNKITGDYIPLSTKVREKNNFFNSSITIGDEIFNERNPNSKNTLGFDLLKMEIQNQNNELFDSTTTETNFKFQGKADRFYLFFVAFETEINNDFLEEKTGIINEIASLESIGKSNESKKDEVINKEVAAIKNETQTNKQNGAEVQETLKVITSEEGVVQNKNNNTKVQPKEIAEKVQPKLEKAPKKTTIAKKFIVSEEDIIKEETRIRTMSVPGLDPGYYLITNVFSKKNNAVDWSKTLVEKNYTPATFINPENTYNYVYIVKDKSLKTVYEKWKANKDLAFFHDLWIVEINL